MEQDCKKKIIFIHEGAVTKATARMYLLNELKETQCHLEIWSLQFLRRLWNDLPDEIEQNDYLKINDLNAFKNRIKSHDNKSTIIISSITNDFLTRKVYRFISKEHFLYLYINIFGNIYGKNQLTGKKRLQLAFSSNIFHKILPEVKKIYTRKIYNPIHLVDVEKHTVACSEPRLYAINSNDYESFLKTKNVTTREIQGKYLLFIDVYYPLHPDLPYVYGIKNVDKRIYLKEINDFFDRIENRYNLPIVVALHPKSTYTDEDFGGRLTLKYKTDKLVKDAEAILTHGSTSTTLALIYNKPTLFFYPNYMRLKTPKYVCKLNWMAESLGKQAYEINNCDVNEIDITPFEESFRYDYIYSRMTTKENEMKTNKEILIRIIEKCFSQLNNNI